jgi:hypothetical protein
MRLLLLCFALVGTCHASDAESALVSALRWHYRWFEQLPATTKSIDCKVATFNKAEFAYCEPGKFAIDIDIPQGTLATVTSIQIAFGSFSDELTDFMNHRYFGPPQTPSVRTLSIPVNELAGCKIDLAKTRELAVKGVSSKMRDELARDGVTIRFPYVCQGDPFYFAYFLRNDKVEWIWQIAPDFSPAWSYEKGNEQRRIPDLAMRNLADPSLWFSR